MLSGRIMARIKLWCVLGTMLATFAAGSLFATAAHATPGTSTIHATLNHTVIHKGSSAAVSGTVSPNLHGQTVVLQRFYHNAWRTKATTHLSSTSHFAFNVTGLGGKYIYRVYHPIQKGWHSSKSNSVTLTIQTLQRLTITSHSDSSANWQGRTIHIKPTAYTLRYSYSCAGDTANFMSISWNGQSNGFEYLWSDPPNGHSHSGTWTGHKGARSGYFSVDTQMDCSWSFSATYNAWR